MHEVRDQIEELGRKVEAVRERVEGRMDHMVANYDERLRQKERVRRLEEAS